ncbi:GNAT family N-acetyltransferase [Actomonas aquatica]|uniref:GNAT family N-acetyltransferase n=1 Tax=Actomonas aquatica TaxID=2866162 RepID=A0ABZ1C694_9BACT|nr:GNAT family N-acetyltransferase [Opitutus sp. WL0086]WRQ85830.1 GNAT family N-acetyltransferase [Opitutus sp. WL0086]
MNLRPLSTIAVEVIAALLNRGFADYLVPLRFDAAAVQAMERQDQVDLDASWLLHDGREHLGVLLIARRGFHSRVAGMCLVPEARGRGLGRHLLDTAIHSARERGDTHLHLEVIDQNKTALRLYQRSGFKRVRQLLGYSAAPVDATAPEADDISVHPLTTYIETARQHEWSNLPWQISAPTLAALDVNQHTTLRVGSLLALVRNLPNQIKILRALLPLNTSEPSAADLRALRDRHPAATWRAPALFPVEWQPAFTAAGLTPDDLTQSQLTLEL